MYQSYASFLCSGMSLGFFWLIYTQLSLVPDDGYAIFSSSVTCKVDALWAARKTRHLNLILFSRWRIQAPFLSFSVPVFWLKPWTAGKAGSSLGMSVTICQTMDSEPNQPDAHMSLSWSWPHRHTRPACTLILSPLLAPACRTRGYLWAAIAADLSGVDSLQCFLAVTLFDLYVFWIYAVYVHRDLCIHVNLGVNNVKELFVASIL